MVIYDWNTRCFQIRKRYSLPLGCGLRAQVMPVVPSQSVSFLGLSFPGLCVTPHLGSQGISSGLQPDSCKLLNDTHKRGLSWINCPGSSSPISASLFSTAVLGCSKLFLRAGAALGCLCDASCCRSRVACSQANRPYVCSKPSAYWSWTSSFMLGQRFNHVPWEARQYTVLLCRWQKWHCPPTRKHGHQVRSNGRKTGQWLFLKLIKTLCSGNIHFIITGSYYE